MKISEIFYSIQGEGCLAGIPSVFIRLAGCNLHCRWCDSSYASRGPKGQDLSVKEVLRKADKFPSRFCVVSGGEPMLAKEAQALCRVLRRQGKHITIETNATLPPDGIHCDLASLSPKLSNSVPSSKAGADKLKTHDRMRLQPDAIRKWLKGYSYQLKFVVSTQRDVKEIGALLKGLQSQVPPEKVLLMPEGRTPRAMAARDRLIVEACKKHGYRYCRRVHIDLFGDKRGV